MSGFGPRDVDVFRPYPDEVPYALLADAGVEEDQVLDLDYVRVGKLEGRVVAAYALRPLTQTRFELVALIVEPPYRHSGIGRWLLGHAIGLAETKGGREVLFRNGTPTGRRFLEAMAFVPEGDDLLLALTPE